MYLDARYTQILNRVITHGETRHDRTGVGTISLPFQTLRYDLAYGFPLITGKYTNFKAIKAELLWFLSGSTNVHDLQELGTHIWDDWARPDGTLGPTYGAQLRGTEESNHHVDQLFNVIHSIKHDPTSRRHIITLWNPAQLGDMMLPPCHGNIIQFYVHDDGTLDLGMYQRSADMFLGVPFNIASYALLLMMVAQVTDKTPGNLTMMFGDAHVYLNHIPMVEEYRRQLTYPAPTVTLNPGVRHIDNFTMDDIMLSGYQHGPRLSAPVAV